MSEAAQKREDGLVDEYVRQRLNVEPPETMHDPSAPPTGESGQANEDEQLAAYMDQHFGTGLDR